MIKVVDFRSDTVTRPDAEMRRVMAEAPVGDAVFGDDPSVLALQKQTAELLGKEAALYVPSGTMANLICVLTHCWGRGAEVLLGDRSHIFIFEQGGIAQMGGVHPRTLRTLADGTFSLEELRRAVREDDVHLPVTTLVCVENTHNLTGGKVLPMAWLDQLGETCRELKLPLHMDGARMLNAAVQLGLPPARIVRDCDSVSICLSKGVGAPVGSLAVGTHAFIKRASRLVKVLGGGMRQAGIIAAGAAYALSTYHPHLTLDHVHTQTIARAVHELGSAAVTVEPSDVHTNILLLDCKPGVLTPEQLQAKLEDATQDGLCVRALPMPAVPQLRLVVHKDITTEDVDRTVQKLVKVIRSYD